MRKERKNETGELAFTFGHKEVEIHNRYEALSIANDILIGLWFTIGSVLFFFKSTETAAIWLFVIGSVQLLIRPVIRLARLIQLKRLPDNGTQDF
ncbi:YrhK family protein [Phytohalomonas tamaricis]|uniref:YrhK family protein n=1 Tax=Phytohalomonas tamaricis TaxID=2081032 RepID=UPI000D0BD306|nr:YrhK family protein [Phytohalomonas tamaricis]